MKFSARCAALILITTLFATPAARAEEDPTAAIDAPMPPVKPGTALVRFVNIPGCVMCAKIESSIGELKAKHGAALKTEEYPDYQLSARKLLKEQGLGNHGILVYDRNGKVSWKLDGHNFDAKQLDKAVAAAVNAEPAKK